MWRSGSARCAGRVHRREITEAARKHAARRKGAAVAVSASMAVGPVAAPFAAVAARGRSARVPTAPVVADALGDRAAVRRAGVRTATPARRSPRCSARSASTTTASSARSPAAAVERFQAAHGPAGHRLGRRQDVAALFNSNMSFVGGSGKTTLTVYRPRVAEPPATPDGSEPAATVPTTPDEDADARRSAPRTTAPTSTSPTSTDPATNRAATTNPLSTPAPAPRRRPRAAAAARARSPPRSRAPPPASTARTAAATPTRARTSPRRPAPPSAPPSAAPSPRRAASAAATATSSASSTRAASPRATPTCRRSTPPRAPTSTSAT